MLAWAWKSQSDEKLAIGPLYVEEGDAKVSGKYRWIRGSNEPFCVGVLYVSEVQWRCEAGFDSLPEGWNRLSHGQKIPGFNKIKIKVQYMCGCHPNIRRRVLP